MSPSFGPNLPISIKCCPTRPNYPKCPNITRGGNVRAVLQQFSNLRPAACVAGCNFGVYFSGTASGRTVSSRDWTKFGRVASSHNYPAKFGRFGSMFGPSPSTLAEFGQRLAGIRLTVSDIGQVLANFDKLAGVPGEQLCWSFRVLWHRRSLHGRRHRKSRNIWDLGDRRAIVERRRSSVAFGLRSPAI